MMIDINPCPFCKSVEIKITTTETHYLNNGVFVEWGNGDVIVECVKCGFSVKDATPLSAVREWNRRKNDDQKAD